MCYGDIMFCIVQKTGKDHNENDYTREFLQCED